MHVRAPAQASRACRPISCTQMYRGLYFGLYDTLKPLLLVGSWENHLVRVADGLLWSVPMVFDQGASPQCVCMRACARLCVCARAWVARGGGGGWYVASDSSSDTVTEWVCSLLSCCCSLPSSHWL